MEDGVMTLSSDPATALVQLMKQHGYVPLDDRGNRMSPKEWSKRLLADGLEGVPEQADSPPKNAPLFDWLREEYPGFDWSEGSVTRPSKKGKDGQTTFKFVVFKNYPTITDSRDKIAYPPTLAALALMALNGTKFVDSFAPATQSRLTPLLSLGEPGLVLAKTFMCLPISIPPPEVLQAVAGWFERALKGEPSTIFAGVCPDYTVGSDNRYTFASLGDGVGLVAKRVLKAIQALWPVLRNRGVKAKFVVAIGDFEAGEETCGRLGITREEFHARLRCSQAAFRDQCDPSLPLETPFATEIGDWDGTMARGKQAVLDNRLSGLLKLDDGDVKQICAGRASLYERWYGAGVNALEVLRRQAPEYMAMSTIANENFPNTLVLGGDAPVMSPFMQGLADEGPKPRVRPVVYLRGVNY